MKKTIIIFISICVLLLAGLLISYFVRRNQQTGTSVFAAVPVNAFAIVRSDSYSDLIAVVTQNTEMWQELNKIDVVRRTNDNIFALDSLANKVIGEGNDVLSSDFCVAAINTGASDFDFLFVLSLAKEGAVDKAQSLITKSAVQASPSREYCGYTLSSVVTHSAGKDEAFYYAVTADLFIGSYSTELVEASLRQLQSQASLLDNKSFAKVKSSAGSNVDCNIYVNFETLPDFATCFLRNETVEYISKVPRIGTWAEWDTEIKNKGLLFNGFTGYNADRSDYLSVFRNQKPVRMSITEILPASTSSFISLGLSDIQQFKTDYAQHLVGSPTGSDAAEKIDQLNKMFNVDLLETFLGVFDQEMALAHTEINPADVNENAYTIFQVKSKKLAEDAIVGAIGSYAAQNNVAFEDFVNTINIDRETNYSVYQLPVEYLPAKLFGTVFMDAPARYVAFLDNYMVFSSSLRSMEKFVYSHILGTDLDHDAAYGEFIDRMSKNYNLFVYGHIGHALPLYSEFLNKSRKEELAGIAPILTKYQSFACQFSASQDMMYSNIYLYFNPAEYEKPRTIWESRLDTAIQFKPRMVETHVSSGKDIFIQDRGNTVYMLNNAGRILWKQQIKEPIRSQIHNIDFYKNGKIQYAFSTDNYLYIIDRIGNFVENYPIKLKSPATAGVSVFNYDLAKDYRFVLPCKDKRVYMYSKEGKILPGWEFAGSDTEVTTPIEHFTQGDKDFVVFADKYSLYILNRRGQARITPKEKIEKAPNSAILFDISNGKDKARFVTTDVSGRVVSLYLDGSVDFTYLGSISANHYFAMCDVDNDTKQDFIILNHNQLTAFTDDGNKIFSHSFDNPIGIEPSIFTFSKGDVKVGITDTISHQIYLINSDGSVYDGFPLPGNTGFSVGVFSGGQGKFNLIVGGESNFLYNYRVN